MDRKSVTKIIKFLCLIGLVIQAAFVIPLITAIIYANDFFIAYWTACTLAFIGIYFLLNKTSLELTIKEAILSVNLVWILGGVIGSFGLMILTHISFIDGFFESVSGFTTTGATIYSHVASLPKTALILRSTMNWIGGMGIIVLGIGVISMINPTTSLTLFKSESPGIGASKITPKLKNTAINLWKVYTLLTILNIVLFKIEGMNWFDAVNQAFSTISTGGFSTKNNSFAYWDKNYLILWTAIIFMSISAINFIAHYKALKGDFSGYKSEEVKWFLIVLIVLATALGFVHFFHSHNSFLNSMTNAYFNITSIVTCTGFTSANYSLWGHIAVTIILLSMLMGGNAGSTAGGIKTIRYVILFKNLKYQIKKILFPNAIFSVKVDNIALKANVISHVGAFLFLYILTNATISLYLLASGYDPITSLSATLSCVNNIGAALGKVGPAYNFAFFTPVQKIILSIGMIIGRLEFFTVIILLHKDFWKK